MGKDNRARRTARKKDRFNRLHAQYRAEEARTRQSPSVWERADGLISEATVSLTIAADLRGSQYTVRANEAVAALADDSDPALSTAVDTLLFQQLMTALVRRCWPGGWQPADLARIATREVGMEGQRAAADLMAAQLREYASATVDATWHDQMADLEASVWWTRDTSYVRQFTAVHGLDRAKAVETLARLLNLFWHVPNIEHLTPPPGHARNGDSARDADRRGARKQVDEKLLTRVRALLAKAESTNYEAEAETFTAAAQAMMARHSIDQAMLDDPDGKDQEKPRGIRLGVENPYADAKSTLIHQIAEANRCHAVWSRRDGFSTVFGFRTDTAWVELLYTSLLVQATAAMTKAGTSEGTRTRGFRSSFLGSFARRIGERLRETTEQAQNEAVQTAGNDLLPVLARRDEAVEAELQRLFPDVFTRRSRTIADHAGWAAGRAAADLADLARRSVAGPAS